MSKSKKRYESLKDVLFLALGGAAGALAVTLLPRLGLKPLWAASATAAAAGAGATFARGPVKMACGGAAAAAVAQLVQLWMSRPAAAAKSDETETAHVGAQSALEMAIDEALADMREQEQDGGPPPQPSPRKRGEGVEGMLSPGERVKFVTMMRELPPESRRAVEVNLSRLPPDQAVAFLRELFERHTQASGGEADARQAA